MMNRLFDFFFPPLCLHCGECLKQRERLFCKGCTVFFELIDPSGRCVYCFQENEGRRPCEECVKKRRWQIKAASALDYAGSVSSLVKKLKYGRMPYLAKTGSAFMTAQFYRLDWPFPDIIVPVPRRHWFQGMNHAHLLAQKLAEALSADCRPLIKRKAGDLSQARLDKSQREGLLADSFYIKPNLQLDGKVVLIVDDVLTTGTTLRHCAEALWQAFPKQVYGFTLARTC